MLPNLQVLRAVAAYLVVFVHLSELLPEDPITKFLHSKGYSGVDLFFVISGFIMVYTTSHKPISAGQFLLNRIRRIVPLYYLFTFFVFGIVVASPSFFRSTSVDIVGLLKSLAFVPFEKSPRHIYPLYYLGWTLNYEMFFYLIFAFSLSLSYKRRVAICTIILCGLVFSRANSTEPGNLGLYFYSRPIMLDFSLGMLLALFRDDILIAMRRLPVLPWLTLCLGVVSLLSLSSLFPNEPSYYDPPTNTFLTFGLPAGLIVTATIGLTDIKTQGQPWHFLQEIGNASYSIYLSHYFVVGGLIALANKFGVTPTVRILLAVIAIPLTALIGICLYRIFERPVGKALTRWTSLRSNV